jgi:N-terminal domain of reverse transcriptase
MPMMLSEPKGKLDAMTGYSFSTPVWDGRAWVRAAPAEEKAAPEGMPDWDTVDWRVHEGNVRRLRQRIFKASREQDWPKVRSLQKMTAPRGALSYPRLSREEFEGRFLGLMPYLELKGEGNRSMAGN